MIIIKTTIELKKWIENQRETKKSTGFVPTMGALHEGRISLVTEALQHNDEVIVSIFVNPAQFNDPADFEKYPITIEEDIRLLEEAGCHLLFLPAATEIYPSGHVSSKHYDLGYLETVLEGKYRPGHFQGVCKVVDRLLKIVEPDDLYLGQKDHQQCMVIKRLIHLLDADQKINLHIVPTIREASGLAMSSRNRRLNNENRLHAKLLYEVPENISSEIMPGNIELLKKNKIKYLEQNGFQVDYIEIADAGDLQTINVWDGKTRLVALVAAFLQGVRLIDNLVIPVRNEQ